MEMLQVRNNKTSFKHLRNIFIITQTCNKQNWDNKIKKNASPRDPQILSPSPPLSCLINIKQFICRLTNYGNYVHLRFEYSCAICAASAVGGIFQNECRVKRECARNASSASRKINLQFANLRFTNEALNTNPGLAESPISTCRKCFG